MSFIQVNEIQNEAGTVSFKTAALDTQFSHRNKFINGGMDIWQRGETVEQTWTNEYCADHWYSLGDNKLYPIRNYAIGSERGTAIIVMPSETASYCGLRQRIEDGYKMRGKKATISFYATAGAAALDSSYMFIQFEGGTAEVNDVPMVNGFNSYTFDIPTDGDSTAYLNVNLLFNKTTAIGSTSNFALLNLQFEEGEFGTDHKYEPVAEV